MDAQKSASRAAFGLAGMPDEFDAPTDATALGAPSLEIQGLVERLAPLERAARLTAERALMQCLQVERREDASAASKHQMRSWLSKCNRRCECLVALLRLLSCSADVASAMMEAQSHLELARGRFRAARAMFASEADFARSILSQAPTQYLEQWAFAVEALQQLQLTAGCRPDGGASRSPMRS
ncbi:MAG: hypothetical protein U1E65_02190 [Myxococcota bacterium]